MRAARALREEETVADCEYAERHQDSGRSRSYRPFGVWGQITWACARRTRSAQAIKLRAFSPNSSRPTIGSNRWAEARGNIPVLWDNVMFLNRSYGKRSISSFLEGRRVGTKVRIPLVQGIPTLTESSSNHRPQPNAISSPLNGERIKVRGEIT